MNTLFGMLYEVLEFNMTKRQEVIDHSFDNLVQGNGGYCEVGNQSHTAAVILYVGQLMMLS